MKKNKFRYSILTYNFAGYEVVHEVQKPQDDVEYIMVTDDPDLKSDTWKIVHDRKLEKMDAFGKTFYVRYHPWEYVHSDVCVRMDASIWLLGSLDDIIWKFLDGGYDCAVIPHPQHYDMRVEYDVWVRDRMYPRKRADRQIDLLINLGYDFDYRGMLEQTLVIQKNSKVNHDIDRITYSLIMLLSDDEGTERLDQTITSYVIQHVIGKEHIKVMFMHEMLMMSGDLMLWMVHGEKKLCHRPSYEMYSDFCGFGYFFDSVVETLYITKTPIKNE